MDVAGIGVPFFDQLISIDVLPVTDNHTNTLESSWQYGGKVPTALVALARLGHRAAMHANVGGIFGRCIRLDFERHGVDCSHLIDIPGTNSPITVCLAEKTTGGRSFVGFKHPAAVPGIKPEELNKTALLEAGWLLISDTDAPSLQAAKWFKEAGKPVVIDADYYTHEALGKLEFIDHFIASEYAYKNLIGEKPQENYEENLRDLRKWQKSDRAVTVVTLGAGGVAGIDEDNKFFRLPAYTVPVIDTTGAGDVFHGAYIAGRLQGLDTAGACQFAQAVSAVKCTQLGGRAGIPDLKQVKEFMDTGRYDFPELHERSAYYRESPFDRLI
ncbi:MAG: carbohydrate kinase family protein [Oscillospiraceae bacterium]|nr:carbohydrate kinase family protein [Oscillospiraceae bacterium]